MPKKPELLDVLFEIARELALNTAATKAIEKHLDKLNGSVATHQSIINVLQRAVDANTTTLTEQQKDKREQFGVWKRLGEKVLDYITIGVITLVGIAVWQYFVRIINQ